MIRRTKKKKLHDNFETRRWEPWTEEENYRFFESLERNSRNWGEIAKDIGTKKQEQVRAYYYRVLRKINRLLKSVKFDLDNRDRTSTLIALISFWEIKCETKIDDNSVVFADAVKSRIIRQRNSLEEMRSQRLPSPESLVIHLFPKLEENSKLLSFSGFNPKLQLKIKSHDYVNDLIEQIMSKWVDNDKKFIGQFPLILYPHGTHHQGFSLEDTDIKILDIYHLMGCPNKFKLDYMWCKEVPTNYAFKPERDNERYHNEFEEINLYTDAACNLVVGCGREESEESNEFMTNEDCYYMYDSPFSPGQNVGDMFYDMDSYQMELKL